MDVSCKWKKKKETWRMNQGNVPLKCQPYSFVSNFVACRQGIIDFFLSYDSLIPIRFEIFQLTKQAQVKRRAQLKPQRLVHAHSDTNNMIHSPLNREKRFFKLKIKSFGLGKWQKISSAFFLLSFIFWRQVLLFHVHYVSVPNEHLQFTSSVHKHIPLLSLLLIK